MSLNRAQLKQTSIELNENLRVSGLTPEAVRADLGLSARELDAVLHMTDENPTAVWRVRDYLEKKILEQDKEPYPYSSLITNIWYRYD